MTFPSLNSTRLARVGIVFLLVFSCVAARADENAGNEFWAANRIEHASVSAAITAGTYGVLRKRGMERWPALLTSMTVSLMLGFAKEATDSFIDTADLRADAIGTAGGGALVFVVDVAFF